MTSPTRARFVDYLPHPTRRRDALAFAGVRLEGRTTVYSPRSGNRTARGSGHFSANQDGRKSGHYPGFHTSRGRKAREFLAVVFAGHHYRLPIEHVTWQFGKRRSTTHCGIPVISVQIVHRGSGHGLLGKNIEDGLPHGQ